MLWPLFVKELAYFLVLTVLGSGFAAFLPRRLGPGGRLAFAPAFGLAVGTGLLTTVNFFVPLHGALWFALLPAALVSAAVALRRGNALPSIRDVLQFAVVCGLVFAVFNAPLHKRLSDGPIAYGVADAPGYVQCIDAFAHHTTKRPLTYGNAGTAFTPTPGPGAWQPPWNLATRYCWYFEFQHTASMEVPAAMASSLGWYPWQALSPWMIVLVMAAALGALGLFRVLTRSDGWVGVAAAATVGTAASFQQLIDGGAGMLSALALIPAIVGALLVAVEEVAWSRTALVGVLLAGLSAVYPEVGVEVLIGGGLWLAVLAVRSLRRARSPRAIVRGAVPHLVLAAVVALVVFPRATLWSFGNAKFAKDAATAASLPHYLMPPSDVIGWIFQTRELYTFVYGGTHGIGPALVGTVFPLLLLGVVLYGVVRRPAAGILLLFAAAATGQAIYLNRSSGCTYCVNRSFMPIMPLVGVALFLGLRELARSPGPWRREVAGFVAGVFALAVGASVLSLEHRAERGSWMPSADVRTVASAVHHDVNATVAMEGWAQTPTFAWSENPTMYAAITEATKQRVSIVAAYSDFGGFGYLRTRPVGDPAYTPNYTYVVTRLNALDTGRPVVRRTRFATIEKRAGPFDAILARGVAVDNYLRDAGGVAHLMPEPVAGPLTFWVSALSPQRAFLRVWLSAPGLRPTARNAVARNQRGQSYVCVPVAGTGSLRIVELHFPKAAGALVPFDMGPFDNDEPDVLAPLIQSGAAVNRVRVDTTPCAPGR